MRFEETRLPGAFVIDLERLDDDRGFFARTWCAREFAEHGLKPSLAQCSLSFNRRRGTLRGMHYQADPFAEAKLVRCARGTIYDVAIDLRPDSPTRFQWLALELSAAGGRMLYVPEGFAHGFQTLADNAEVFYQISEFHHAESGRGIRWNDPFFNIAWPLPDPILSPRDQSFADFDPAASRPPGER